MSIDEKKLLGLRIELGRNTGDCRFYDSTGRDITMDLQATSLKIECDAADKRVRVTMKCLVRSVKAIADDVVIETEQ